MKTLLLLLFCFTLSSSCFSQKISEIVYEHKGNTFHPRIDSVDSENFNRIRRTGISCDPLGQSIYLPEEVNRRTDSVWKAIVQNRKQDSLRVDSLVRWVKANYPSSMTENDSTLILHGSDRKIILSNRSNSNEQEWANYEFKDYQQGYLVIAKYGYEQWEYIVFNPITRNYKYLEHAPHFLNDSLVYCSENYYSEGGFQIMQLTGNLYFGFESYGWELEECYRVNKTFYFSFRSNVTPSLQAKYLTINFEAYL